MTIKVLEKQIDCHSFEKKWNELLINNSNEIVDVDFTSAFDWVMSLWSIHLEATDQLVVVNENKAGLLAVLPIHRATKKLAPFKVNVLAPMNTLYAGRSGFVSQQPMLNPVAEIYQHILEHVNGWDVFEFTFVNGSPSLACLHQIIDKYHLSCRVFSTQTSPYIEFQGQWEDYLKAMPKKLRWTMKNAEKRMRELGELRYKQYSSESDAEPFLAEVLKIETESWKEAAGTAISGNEIQQKFYKDFTPKAGKNGWFSGHVIFINDEPVAYVYGIIFGDVFYDLKESYKAKYRNMSPGHVLKSLLFQHLFDKQIHFYDFMGACEEYKMRWTDKTYSRSTYVVYNKTLKGKLLFLRALLTERLSGLKAMLS